MPLKLCAVVTVFALSTPLFAFHDVKPIGRMADGKDYYAGYWGATAVIIDKSDNVLNPDCEEKKVEDYRERIQKNRKRDYYEPRYDRCRNHEIRTFAEGNFFIAELGATKVVLDLRGQVASEQYHEIACAPKVSRRFFDVWKCKGTLGATEESFEIKTIR